MLLFSIAIINFSSF